MPDIYGPDGVKYSFPDGMPTMQIQAFMASKYGGPKATPGADQPPPPPVGAPLATPGGMPPGSTPGQMNPQPHAPDASMLPLSADAHRAQRMMEWGALSGNRTLEAAGKARFEQDPTAIARKVQAQKAGEDAGILQQKQAAGTRVYAAMDELEQKVMAWMDHAPKAFNAATGEYNSLPSVQFATGWMNQGGQAFHRMLEHDIAKMTALYREMPGSSKGSGSDAQDANFKEAMGEFIKAKTPTQALAILQSAKQLIRDKGGLPHGFELPPRPMHPRDVAAVREYATTPMGDDSPYVTGIPREQAGTAPKASPPPVPPVEAIDELLRNAGSPKHVDSFNRHFNSGKPGLAEHLIEMRQAEQRAAPPSPPLAPPNSVNPHAPHNLLRRLFGLDPVEAP